MASCTGTASRSSDWYRAQTAGGIDDVNVSTQRVLPAVAVTELPVVGGGFFPVRRGLLRRPVILRRSYP